ncbi:MAG: GNAT family N-acetyltransferase [Anaerolineales bacterium]|nr:GNAT family N-acetyltransferase [Anaerolineales bacterium]
MNIQFRHYNTPDDYKIVDGFLINNYLPGNADGNWIQPAWEYMHGHSLLDQSSLGKIGIWMDESKIVAVAHYEWRLGEAFFQFHPEYRFLCQEMLDYAENNLFGRSRNDGSKYLQAYINDCDQEFLALVIERGYQKDDEEARPMAIYDIPDPFPAIHLPAGFRLTSLADECDWEKVHRVLHRGFDHPGEPPAGENELEERRKMFDTPTARRDLKVAVQAPNGDFVAFCGMFYEPAHQYAYVEPVATDPDYRRMGLGRAAVLEGIRRCGALGATVAYVGSDQEFYLSLGFRVVYTSECWVKHLQE